MLGVARCHREEPQLGFSSEYASGDNLWSVCATKLRVRSMTLRAACSAAKMTGTYSASLSIVGPSLAFGLLSQPLADELGVRAKSP